MVSQNERKEHLKKSGCCFNCLRPSHKSRNLDSEAVGEHGNVPVQLLLDNGSQLSYITTSLRSRLRLKSVRQEKLFVNTFGSDLFAPRGCDAVTLTLRKPGTNEGLEIMARTSPVICSSLPSLVNVSNYTHLKCLDLADSGSLHQGTIDILMGSDYYW